MNKLSKHPITIIIFFLIGFLLINLLKNKVIELMASDGTIELSTKYFITAAFNIVYTIISYWLIKKYDLIHLSGMGKQKLKNWFLLLFPLYIVLLNWPEPGDIDFSNIPAINYVAMIVWALSVGLSEEFMLRGFMQSLIIKANNTSKTKIVLSVIGAAVIFGLLHLVKFDKGLYGEITQVLYATFIGTMFGAILLRTHKIWPLVVVHTLIDISGNLKKFEATETTVNLVSTSQQELTDSITIVLLLLPCFIYGLILLRKVTVEDIQTKTQKG